MPRPRSPRRIPLLFLLLTLLLPTLARAEGPPVVVAVDTSRSLDPAALGEVVNRLRLALQDLPADAPAGLVAFDDEPRWVVETGASPAEVAAALRGLTLRGNFTLLHDALFVATRELEDGGVILLATDGRDENSATTVDDIARRCEAQGVRILSVGTGRAIEERALRRLALVSNGRYLGDVRRIEASGVAEALSGARDAVAEDRARRVAEEETSRAAATPPPRPSAGQPATRSAAATADSDPLMTWLPWILAGVSVLLVVYLLARRRPAPAPDDEAELEATRLDEAEEDERSADVAEAEVIRLELAQADAAAPREAPEVTVDTTVFQEMSLEDRLERTRVLSNEGVLVMKRMGEAPRSFLLDSEKAFAVGRDRESNTLAVPDPSISSQHFKIVPRDGAYYFVDLGSTNGSYVSGRPVNAKRLRSGDVIRAGQVEFEFQNYSNV